jgi:hypothetical protein
MNAFQRHSAAVKASRERRDAYWAAFHDSELLANINSAPHYTELFRRHGPMLQWTAMIHYEHEHDLEYVLEVFAETWYQIRLTGKQLVDSVSKCSSAGPALTVVMRRVMWELEARKAVA